MPLTIEEKRMRRLEDLEDACNEATPLRLPIMACRRPLKDDEAQKVAEAVLGLLDCYLDKRQVYSVAEWIRYLSTQH